MPAHEEARFAFLLGTTTLNLVLIATVLVYGAVESQTLSSGEASAARPVWEVLSFALPCGVAASATIEILKRVFGPRGLYISDSCAPDAAYPERMETQQSCASSRARRSIVAFPIQRRQARLWLNARQEGAYEDLLDAMGTRPVATSITPAPRRAARHQTDPHAVQFDRLAIPHQEGDLLSQAPAAAYSRKKPCTGVILVARPDGIRLPDRWIQPELSRVNPVSRDGTGPCKDEQPFGTASEQRVRRLTLSNRYATFARWNGSRCRNAETIAPARTEARASRWI